MKWKALGVIALIAGSGTAAWGKDLSIGEKEQNTIAQICEIAARAPNVALETTAGVAAWCVQWVKRVNEVASPAAEKKQ